MSWINALKPPNDGLGKTVRPHPVHQRKRLIKPLKVPSICMPWQYPLCTELLNEYAEFEDFWPVLNMISSARLPRIICQKLKKTIKTQNVVRVVGNAA